MTLHWSDFLRGANGGLEINRVVSAFGGFAYIIGAHAFIATELAMGRGFDLSTYCLTFPTGLAAVVGGGAFAVSIKDKAVASAKVIEETGAVPAPPPDGPRVPVEPKS